MSIAYIPCTASASAPGTQPPQPLSSAGVCREDRAANSPHAPLTNGYPESHSSPRDPLEPPEQQSQASEDPPSTANGNGAHQAQGDNEGTHHRAESRSQAAIADKQQPGGPKATIKGRVQSLAKRFSDIGLPSRLQQAGAQAAGHKTGSTHASRGTGPTGRPR